MSALDLYAFRQEHGGVVFEGGRRGLFPGPGHSRRDRSLSVRLNDDGRALVYSFAKDPFPICAEYLGISREKVDRPSFSEVKRLKAEREAAAREANDRAMSFCASLWTDTEIAEGTVVETYLTARGIGWPYPEDIRFHPAAPLDYGRRFIRPAMVALVKAADGQPTGLHITALSPDGTTKAAMDNPRRMFGKVGGCSVQLLPPDQGELAVAEGIETALSFQRMNGIPTWAALSSPGLDGFVIPEGVTLLNIAVDGDQAGRHAGDILTARARKKVDVVVADPGDGLDFNDLLMARPHG